MARDPYVAQVALLIQLLPFVAAKEVFTLKGSAAITLFYRERCPVKSCELSAPSAHLNQIVFGQTLEVGYRKIIRVCIA